MRGSVGLRRGGPGGGNGEALCHLCGGELYPGEPYFDLDGNRVCPACLERYARRHFAHRLRWVGSPESEET